MRKKARIALLLFTVACCGAFAVYRSVSVQREDNVPPVITVPSDVLHATVNTDKSSFLSSVSAVDDIDGDVTDSLIVERVFGMTDENHVTVTIAAFDSSGNTAKAKRTVEYEDYIGPRFTLSTPLIFHEGVNSDVFEFIGAQDVIDGELDDRIKATLLDGNTSISGAGVYNVEFRVTNSIGDTSSLTVPVEVYSGDAYNAQISLDNYIVYLKTGGDFDPQSHICGITAGGSEYLPSQLPIGSLDVESDVDTHTLGTYTVTYRFTMNQYRGCTRLIAVVED